MRPVDSVISGGGKKADGMKKLKRVAPVVAFLLVLTARDAHAYLDPASGSMILQVIVAAVAAVLITLKAFWHKIRGMFGASPKEESAESDDKG
jgi:hypothetical protein